MSRSLFHQKPNVYVGEVVVKVQDLERSIKFYQEIIGLKVLRQEERRAELTADGKTALVTIEQPADVVAHVGRTSGLYHFAILLPSRADLSVFLRHLLETKYYFGASDHLVSEALYLSDPDGNGIEVYHDRAPSEWTWNGGKVAMVTDPLDGEGILAESNAAWQGLSADTLMGHIHLHVADQIKAEQFYTKLLGFKTVSDYPQASFMSTGDYHHHIAVNTWQGVGAPPTPENSVGLSWYSLVFPDEAARSQTVAQLELHQAPLKHGTDYVETSDPAGNRIRLVVGA
jgi:catechol 2,3-dioxygenase